MDREMHTMRFLSRAVLGLSLLCLSLGPGHTEPLRDPFTNPTPPSSPETARDKPEAQMVILEEYGEDGGPCCSISVPVDKVFEGLRVSGITRSNGGHWAILTVGSYSHIVTEGSYFGGANETEVKTISENSVTLRFRSRDYVINLSEAND